MNIEETDKGIKISVPIMTNIEENVIDNNYKRIVDEFSKQLVHEKDLLIAQRLIKNLQAELDKKDKIIEELAGMVFDSRKLTYVDEEQYKERKKEIIEYAEGQATGRAM